MQTDTSLGSSIGDGHQGMLLIVYSLSEIEVLMRIIMMKYRDYLEVI